MAEIFVNNTGSGGAYTDFQAALNAAQYGDTVTVEAGSIFNAPGLQTPYIMPAKTGTPAYITIRSSAHASLPAGRVGPGDTANMFKLVSLGVGGALSVQTGTQYWKITGCEITNWAPADLANWTSDLNMSYTPLELGIVGGVHHIWVDQCYIHPKEWGTPVDDTHRSCTTRYGIGANLDYFTVTRSYIAGGRGWYQHAPGTNVDGCGIAVNIGHHHVWDDNYIAGSFAGFFLGGGGVPWLNSAIVQASPAPTLTSCKLDNLGTLAVGDYISFQQSNNPNPWACGIIQSIDTGTNVITYTSLFRIINGAAPPVEPPMVGGYATWNGDLNQDFTITHNTFDMTLDGFTPYYWNLTGISYPKGYFEVKHVDGWLLEGNIFKGWPCHLTINASNQNGDTPWTVVKNVTWRSNWIQQNDQFLSFAGGNPYGYQAGHMLKESENILIENNLVCLDPSTNPTSGDARITSFGDWGLGINVTIKHNTFVGEPQMGSNFMSCNGIPTNFNWYDNIWYFNLYGWSCDSSFGGGFNCWNHNNVHHNLIANNTNAFVTNQEIQDIFWFDTVVGSATAPLWVGSDPYTLTDWALQTGSAGHNTASDNTDMGVNITTLAAALAGGTGDVTDPTGSITFPSEGATISGTITVTASASDDVAVAGVQFKHDANINIGAEDTSAPYSVSFDTTTVANGAHTIYAVIRDTSNNTFTSASVNVTVNNAGGGDTTPPSGSITSPSDGAIVNGTIAITASASDNIAVAGVQFKLDGGTNIGAEDTSSPYSVNLDTTGLSDGAHTIYAVVRDTSNNTYTTAVVNVTVANATGPMVCKWSTPIVCVGSAIGDTFSEHFTDNQIQTSFWDIFGTSTTSTYAEINQRFEVYTIVSGEGDVDKGLITKDFRNFTGRRFACDSGGFIYTDPHSYSRMIIYKDGNNLFLLQNNGTANSITYANLVGGILIDVGSFNHGAGMSRLAVRHETSDDTFRVETWNGSAWVQQTSRPRAGMPITSVKYVIAGNISPTPSASHTHIFDAVEVF